MSGWWLLGDLRQALAAIMYGLQIPIFGYFLLVNSSYLMLILLAGWGSLRYIRRLEHSGRREAQLPGAMTPDPRAPSGGSEPRPGSLDRRSYRPLRQSC